MNKDNFSFALYIFVTLLVVTITVYRMHKRAKNSKNLYRSGNPVKLAERIELHGRLSREEFIQINGQVIKKMLLPKYFKYFIGFMLAGMVISLFMPSFTEPGTEIDYLPIIKPFFFIAIFIGIAYYYFRTAIGKGYDNTEFIKGEVTYIFDSDNYEMISSVSNIKSSWATVQGYIEGDNFLLVYTGATQGLFLRKQDFTPQQLTVFTDFLNNNFYLRKRGI